MLGICVCAHIYMRLNVFTWRYHLVHKEIKLLFDPTCPMLANVGMPSPCIVGDDAH